MGGQHAVEVRANQSSLFGMLSPLVGMAGALPGLADSVPSGGGAGAAAHQGFGPAPTGGQGAGYPMDAPGVAGFYPADGDAAQGQAAFGAAGTEGFGGPSGQGGFGPAAGGQGGFGAAAGGQAGFGAAAGGHGGFGPEAGGTPADGAGPAGHLFSGGLHEGGGLGGFGGAIGDALTPGGTQGEAPGTSFAVPEGYHAGLDLDGDGRDDEHILRGRADGGVDILVDRDGDGQVDIIGHDDDADGHVESTDYDKDGDGHFERTRYDDDGDGWLDRTVVNEEGAPPETAVDLSAIAKHLRMS